MPSKHTLNVSLTGELRDFVSEQVASGRFRTSSEVVRAALRLLEREATGAYPSPAPDLAHDVLIGTKARKSVARSRSLK
jgi:putative addiction module CopG family antidote